MAFRFGVCAPPKLNFSYRFRLIDAGVAHSSMELLKGATTAFNSDEETAIAFLNPYRPMASEQQVRQYLAYWFQLGKRVLIQGGEEALLPRPVIQGNRYSQEFEACWQKIYPANARAAYLEGTNQTVAELLSPVWEINPCSRCSMPVPIRSVGLSVSPECPCFDLPDWPNSEIPQPHAPVDSQALLLHIRDRLRQASRQ